MFKLKNDFKQKIFISHIRYAFLYSSLLFFLAGCLPKPSLNSAQDYLKQSETYYKSALEEYKALIRYGEDLDRLYFELGKLYYSRGEFTLAKEAFQKSNDLQAEKYLGICYYRLGDFTDSLEILDKYKEGSDDEALYYYALVSEKLNLFNQAVKALQKIKSRQFNQLALERINIIKRESGSMDISDISPEVGKWLSGDFSLKQYPQAGALILLCDEQVEVTPQNTQVSQAHYLIKILNERGKEDFSEAHIEYDSTYEKVELEFARTIKPDGEVIEVGKEHIRDVSKYLNFPLYSNARIYIISFPEIVEGASVEYKIKIQRNQLINKNDFVLSYPLQTSEPIIRADFRLTIPKNKKLRIKILNNQFNNFGAKLDPVLRDNGASLTYSWGFQNITQIIPEANMPAAVEVTPTVILSTFQDWQDIYAWWWDLAKDKIIADNAIRQEVKKLTENLNSEEEKARAIYNFCAQKIRYVAVEYGQAGYEPHKAEDIFKNKYGDCKDQSMLLVAMLHEAGLSAWPVLISAKGYYDLLVDFPSVLFNHCIVALSLKGEIIFLDPTAETCSFGGLPSLDQERKVLVFKEDGYQIKDTPLYPAGHNLLKQSLTIRINDDESIEADRSVLTKGIYDQSQRNWLLYTPPELIFAALQENIQSISIGAKLKDYNIRNLDNLNIPLILDYRFSGPEYFTSAGNLMILPQLSYLDASLVAKEKRKYPIDLHILDLKDSVFEVAIPANFVIKYMPESVNEDSPWLKYSTEYGYKDNKIYFKQSVELKKNRILEAEYPDFKRFFENLAKKIKQRIVLERAG